MNTIFVKRGQACLENSGLHWRFTLKERKKEEEEEEKTFNGRELHMYRPSTACTWNNIIFNFIRFTSQTESTTQLMEYFVTGYSMEKVHMGTIAYITVIGKQCNLFISVILI